MAEQTTFTPSASDAAIIQQQQAMLASETRIAQAMGHDIVAEPVIVASTDFNWAAMKGVYQNADIDLKGQFNWFGAAADFDVNAAMKAANADTNFAAIKALYPESAEFLSVIEQHSDMKNAVNNLLKDEGMDVLKDIQGLMTGEGALDQKQLAEALEDPAKRGLFVDAIELAATNKENTAFVVEFSRRAMKATSGRQKDQNDFLKFAQEHGIDTQEVETAALRDFMDQFWNGDTKGAVIDLIGKMGLSPEMNNMLVGVLAPLAEGMKGLADSWVNGSPTMGPGISQLASYYSQKAPEDGAKEIAAYEERQRMASGISSGPTMMGG